MDKTLSAVFLKVPEGYAGFVEELPGTNSLGPTLDEARRALRETVAHVLEAHRALTSIEADGDEVVREELSVSWPDGPGE